MGNGHFRRQQILTFVVVSTFPVRWTEIPEHKRPENGTLIDWVMIVSHFTAHVSFMTIANDFGQVATLVNHNGECS